MDQLYNYLTDVQLLGIDVWRVAAAVTVVVVGFALQGLLFDQLIRPLHGVFEDTESTFDELLIEKLHAPFNWLVRLLALYVGLRLLALPERADHWIDLGTTTLGTLFVAWMLFRGIDVIVRVLDQFTEETDSEIDDQLVPVVRRIMRFFMVTIAILAIIQQWGYNVGSLLAGLGIGGLAFALAARQMLSNWFGALMIFTDRPFQIGEWVETDYGTGAVEEVGLRATRIRQYSREKVIVPNSEMASTAVTNLSARDRRRIDTELGLVYGTTHEQMHEIIENIRTLLDDHEEVWDGDWRVFFVEFGDHALTVEVSCFTKHPDITHWRRLRQELFLAFMRIVEEAGSQLAFPTRSIHIEGGDEEPAPVGDTASVPEPAPGE